MKTALSSLSFFLLFALSVIGTACAQSSGDANAEPTEKAGEEKPLADKSTPASGGEDVDEAEAGAEVEEEKPTQFLRYVEIGKRAQLQTATVRYENEDGVRVSLVSACHVGDAGYYDKLNEELGDYETVLYELVLPANVPKVNQFQMKQIGNMQRFLTDVLGLEHQMQGIDYEQDHFVHADMDMKQFIDKQKEKGESFMGLYFQAMSQQLNAQRAGRPVNATMTAGEWMALFDEKQRGMVLKLNMARSMGLLVAGEDEMIEGDSVIVGERNKVDMNKLRRAVKREKAKDIAIFYGAAHMPDFEERLAKLGYKKTEQHWTLCWNMLVP